MSVSTVSFSVCGVTRIRVHLELGFLWVELGIEQSGNGTKEIAEKVPFTSNGNDVEFNRLCLDLESKEIEENRFDDKFENRTLSSLVGTQNVEYIIEQSENKIIERFIDLISRITRQSPSKPPACDQLAL